MDDISWCVLEQLDIDVNLSQENPIILMQVMYLNLEIFDTLEQSLGIVLRYDLQIVKY